MRAGSSGCDKGWERRAPGAVASCCVTTANRRAPFQAVSKFHRRKARALHAEQRAACDAASPAAAVTGSPAPALPTSAAAAAPLPDCRTDQQQPAGDLSPWPSPGIHYAIPHGKSDESQGGGPRPQDAAASRAWLGWQQWDWDARAWGPEREEGAEEPSAELAPSDHDEDLTEEALRQLVTNEKLMIAVRKKRVWVHADRAQRP